MGELGLDGGVSVGFGCGSPYRQFFVLRAPIVASLLAIVFLNSRYFHPKSPEMVYLKILTAVIAIILGVSLKHFFNFFFFFKIDHPVLFVTSYLCEVFYYYQKLIHYKQFIENEALFLSLFIFFF